MFLKICMATIFCFSAYMTHLNAETDSSKIYQNTSSQYSEQKKQEQTKKDIQNQAQQAKEEIQKILVPEAISIVDETKNAIQFIKNGHNAEAVAALERATGKSDVLLARYPEGALLPVDFAIQIIDLAPNDLYRINQIEKLIKKSINNKNYPTSRSLLNLLSSEIHVVIPCLPLAYYPLALKEAASLLEMQQAPEASLSLEDALHTLVLMRQIFPIPAIKAIALLKTAENIEGNESNREAVLTLINEAKFELNRAIELGYLRKNECRVFNEEFANVEYKIKKGQKATLSLDSLKEKFRAVLKASSKPEVDFQ